MPDLPELEALQSSFMPVQSPPLAHSSNTFRDYSQPRLQRHSTLQSFLSPTTPRQPLRPVNRNRSFDDKSSTSSRPTAADTIIPRHRPVRRFSKAPSSSNTCLQVPCRLCRLLALVILLPSLFVLMPLYFRYRVYSGQIYPMSMTDMRLIDSKISPTWCQRQVVRSNTTFNAFVLPGAPEFANELVPVSMTRELVLQDDMKEYWGFYLLEGSTVTVSACVSWPGASLIMIKGYKHLKDCAYIGDDSSEELDELKEANELGLLSNETLREKIRQLEELKKKTNLGTNNPDRMKKHKAGVNFHDPSHKLNVTNTEDQSKEVDEIDHDPKQLQELLEKLNQIRQAQIEHQIREAEKEEKYKHYQLPAHMINIPNMVDRHHAVNVDREEFGHLFFNDTNGKSASPLTTTDIAETHEEVATQATDIDLLEHVIENTYDKYMSAVTPKTEEKGNMNMLDLATNSLEENKQIVVTEEKYTTKRIDLNVPDTQDPILQPKAFEEPNSKEVFETVLHQLQSLGDRGKKVLLKLHEKMGVKYDKDDSRKVILSKVINTEVNLDRMQKVLVEAIDEEKTNNESRRKRREAASAARAKREAMTAQIQLEKEFNEDDEPRNVAAEEDLHPDGYADSHQHINETTPFDMSNSELWSSFSSSEEALLACDGLILNLPLTPHHKCKKGSSEAQTMEASKRNALTYRVPANGYYFFVFNSENEKQDNFIRARFDLQKTRYDVYKTALRECKNSTERCDLTLDIFSSQKVVLEVPLRNNDSLWNEQFIIISECEPRTSVYLACVIAVPILILIFGFQ